MAGMVLVLLTHAVLLAACWHVLLWPLLLRLSVLLLRLMSLVLILLLQLSLLLLL